MLNMEVEGVKEKSEKSFNTPKKYKFLNCKKTFFFIDSAC